MDEFTTVEAAVILAGLVLLEDAYASSPIPEYANAIQTVRAKLLPMRAALGMPIDGR